MPQTSRGNGVRSQSAERAFPLAVSLHKRIALTAYKAVTSNEIKSANELDIGRLVGPPAADFAESETARSAPQVNHEHAPES